MRHGHILVEGKTEWEFVQEVLNPHFEGRTFRLTPVSIRTRHRPGSSAFKGGYVSYARTRKQVLNLLSDSSAAVVTTMLDYYALAHDFPGKATLDSLFTAQDRVAHLEEQFQNDIGGNRFIPYLSLHEFEALLFAAPEIIAQEIDTTVTPELNKIRKSFKSPEEIDDQNPPSRRLKDLIPAYDKALHGPLIALAIGLEQIRRACPHFNNWLVKLEQLTSQ
jgi:hypothetical protein